MQTTLAGQPGQRCHVAMMSQIMMVIMLLRDTATVSGVTDAPLSLAAARRQRSPRGIVKPAAIQMRSPVGESQCGNNKCGNESRWWK